MMSQILITVCLMTFVRLIGYDGQALRWERYVAIPLMSLILIYPPAVYFTVPECREPPFILLVIFSTIAIITFLCKGRYEYLRRYLK